MLKLMNSQGDSGGPLVCPHGNDWIQVGIASFTSAKRPGDVPGAFTRVSAYIDWIITTIGENTPPPTTPQPEGIFNIN